MQWHIATFSVLFKNTKRHCKTTPCAKAIIFRTVKPPHNRWPCWFSQFSLGLHTFHLLSDINRSDAISWPDTTFVFQLKYRYPTTHTDMSRNETKSETNHDIRNPTLPPNQLLQPLSMSKPTRA